MVGKIINSIKLLGLAVLILPVLILTVGRGGIVAALSTDDANSIYKDTVWYRGGDVITGGGTGTSICLTGSNDEDRIWNFLRTTMNLGELQAAAIMGNMYVESGFNPLAYNINGTSTTTTNPDPSGHYGIVQWGGGRLTSLLQLANFTDLGVQLNFASQELNGSYKSSVLDPINGSADLSYMVHIINTTYEVSGTSDQPRYDAANDILTLYSSGNTAAGNTVCSGGGTGSGSGGGGGGGSGGSTTSCNVTAPVYGSQNGSGSEYTQDQLTQIFGDPFNMSPNLVNVDFLGHSVQVNKLVAPCLTAVAQEIQANGINYAINDIGCYRFDSDNGTSNIGLRSYHTYGVACDINPSANPFVSGTSCDYSGSYDMPQGYVTAFHNHGFTWGGYWCSVKDYMHFEFNGITP